MGANKTWAMTIGVVLLLVGLLGFIMDSPLLGIFGVNTLHNIVHLLTGALFLWAGMKGQAKTYNKWFGWVYLLVAVLGFFGLLTFLEVAGGNDYDNYLHVVIGLVSVLIAWKASE
jgi:hypothetical protein